MMRLILPSYATNEHVNKQMDNGRVRLYTKPGRDAWSIELFLDTFLHGIGDSFNFFARIVEGSVNFIRREQIWELELLVASLQ